MPTVPSTPISAKPALSPVLLTDRFIGLRTPQNQADATLRVGPMSQQDVATALRPLLNLNTNNIVGTDKRVRFQTAAQLAAATDGGDCLDGLSPATLVLGGLAWVEFHPTLGYGTTLRLLYDGATRTPAGSGLIAFRTGDAVAGDTVPVRWAVASGPQVGVAAYPQKPAGYVFALNELVRAYVSDVPSEQFFSAKAATALPAPTISTGDANWAAVSASSLPAPVAPLYGSPGTATNGPMTQAATTAALAWQFVGNPNFKNITVGTLDPSNTIGASSYNNTYGANVYNNSFGASHQDNFFGPEMRDSVFGANTGYSTFGAACSANTFGTYFQFNTLGPTTGYCKFGNNISFLNVANNCSYLQVGDNCTRVDIYNCSGTSTAPFVIPAGTTNAVYRNNALVVAPTADTLLGDWNPNTNTPALVAGVGTAGTYYRVATDSLTKTPLALFTATASTQVTITNVFQIAVGFTLTGGGLGAGITVTAIDATNKIITLSAAVSLTAGTQLFFSQTTLGLSRLRVDSQLFFTGTAWIARNNAPVTTAAIGGLARAGRGLSANGLGSLATDWPDFKNEILCPANTTTGAVLGNAYALALNGSLAFAGQDTADFGPYYLGQLIAVRALDNTNGGVTWGIKVDGTSFTAGGDATTVLKVGDFIVARRTLTGYDIVLDGRKPATAAGGGGAATGGVFRGAFAAVAYALYDCILIPAGQPNAGLFAYATAAFTATATYSAANWTLDPGQSTNDYTAAAVARLAIAVTDTLAVLSYAASIPLDFSAANVQTLAATGAVGFAASLNVAALKTKEIYLTNTTGAAITLTFPTGWSFFPGPAPTSLAAGKQAAITLRALGTTDTTIKAAYVAQV